MIRSVIFFWMVLGLGGSHAQYVVDLNQSPDLKGLFDAGFRPIHARGLEMDTIDQPSVHAAQFKFAEITLPVFAAEWSFQIKKDQKIYTIDGYGRQALSREETYSVLDAWEKACGFIDYESKLRAFCAPGSEVTFDGNLWGRRVERKLNGVPVRMNYYLRHSQIERKPFLMTVTFQWDFPKPEREKGTEPLQSPPGYESHDMRMPEVIEAERRRRERAAGVVKPLDPGSGVPIKPAEVIEEGNSWWKWLLVLVVLAVGFTKVRRQWKAG
jgi:hypothetical protein